MKSFIFLGGDMRSVYAAERLGERYDCYICGFDGAEGIAAKDTAYPGFLCDNAVLPLPASLDEKTINAPYRKAYEPLGFDVLAGAVKPGGTVFTSKIFPKLRYVCEENGFNLVNYFEREELAVLNAVPTAEGAVSAAIINLPVTIHGTRVLIAGYGRIGRITARYFSALGADVMVSARKQSDIAWIKAENYRAVRFYDIGEFQSAAASADIIINTVPSLIFDRKTIALMKKQALYIELASADGADRNFAESIGLNIVTARGLPGKTAPETAGRIIADTIENILIERSIENGRA